MQRTDLCVYFLGFLGERGEFFTSHTLSLPISPDPIETHWVWPEMLHIIFEGNKVHINDKTSQSSERGGGVKGQTTELYRELDAVLRGLVMLEYKNT